MAARSLLACVWLAVAMTAEAWSGSAEHRVALVIGNGAYAQSPLKNPRQDAVLMSRTLAAEGFDVMTVVDATADEMAAAITEFEQRLEAPNAVALFYYAGHGLQAAGENYLLPVSAQISAPNDIQVMGVPLSRVFKAMDDAKSRLNIVLLDACRDNPFADGVDASAGLASVVAPSGTIIGFATAPGHIARDGAGANSPYTAALAEYIGAQGLTVEDVFRLTRLKVRDATGNVQTPWEHSSLLSEFYFHSPGDDTEMKAKGVPLVEVADWEAIKSSHDPNVFRAHIAKYPSGLFAELAAVRISRIEAQRSSTPWQWIMTGGIDAEAPIAAASAALNSARSIERAGTDPSSRVAAFRLFEEAATAGLPEAMFSLAQAYDKGRGVTQDVAAAALWYERAAERGHAGAMSALGTMREFGEGTRQDLADALRLYRLAADRGDAAGFASLAFLYSEGKGVSRDQKEARKLYEVAANAGHARAMFNLALMKLHGTGGPADMASAVELLRAAAAKDHARALTLLAVLHDEGRGVPRDAKLAADFYIRSLKAQHRTGQAPNIADGTWRLATRREIQRKLASEGLYSGLVHGYFNRATLQALVVASQQ